MDYTLTTLPIGNHYRSHQLPNIFDAVKPKEKKDGKSKSNDKSKGSGNKKSKKTTKKTGISPETKEKAVAIINQNVGSEKEDFAVHMDSDDKDLTDLIEKSSRAVILKPILENDIKFYKIEREKLAMEKEAGNIIEKEFAEYLYFSYIEKVNRDLITLTKKLQGKLDMAVKEGSTKKVMKLIDVELKSILKEVKKSQQRDLKSWEREL